MRGVVRPLAVMAAIVVVVTACTSADAAGEEDDTTTTTSSEATTTTTVPATTSTTGEAMDHSMDESAVDTEALARANLGAAAFQDVEMAEAGGYVNTIESLGCFEDPEFGGMGLHYLNESLLDDVVEAETPEALVYELDHQGEIVSLVAHEYLVPLEAWTSDEPPALFGVEFHEHPVLPFWILHTWIWKDNPAGMFNDWNPKVRLCPDGVPVFGVDLP